MQPGTIWFKADDADRWQPLAPYRSLPTGHYRLAARLPVARKYLQWRWRFYPMAGKVQSHDFQGRTNGEGLISLLDLHTMQPGTWQLDLQPDLFDLLCGENWHIRFQFQIIAPQRLVATPPPAPAKEASQVEPRPSQKVSNFRSVNYVVELIYPELINPIQVDITVIVDGNRSPTKLDLPDPRRMVGLLYRRPLRRQQSPLPPKLTSPRSE